MPEDTVFRPTETLLQDNEILRLVRIFADLGVKHFRLTGGEPTLRHHIVNLVSHIHAVPGVSEVTMTTNAMRLKRLAEPLARAGIQRINIRLDTLDPDKFRIMSRWGNLDKVWGGISAAEDAGLAIKLNTVVVRGYNEGQDIINLARLTRLKPWHVRFIQVMPLGHHTAFQRDSVVPENELIQRITTELGPLETIQEEGSGGPARMYHLNGAMGQIGFISSLCKPFCNTCQRARLTADGKLRPCLLHENETDLQTLLRNGASDKAIADTITRTLWNKPAKHGLDRHVIPTNRMMSEIGG